MTLALVWALSGCGGSDLTTADSAIRAYNDAAIAAYRTNDASGMPAVALKPEADRLTVLVDLKKGANVVLESTLDSLEVTSASRPAEGELDASTRERWTYFDRPIDPGVAPGPRYVVVMALDYELRREDQAWKVARVVATSSDYLEPPGFRLDDGGGR